jgi:pyruvate dehydrogenase E2 component (dihydrolipoamide acetyltransferase)
VPNLDAQPFEALSPFRKIALGTWKTPYDPQIYGTLRLRMEPALAHIAELRRTTGLRVTLTHFVIKAVGAALAACPDANVVMRWGRPHRRRRVDVSALVALTDGGRPDLSAVKIHDADKKSVAEIAAELAAAAARVRGGGDDGMERARRRMQRTPSFLMGLALRLVTFLGYSLNLDLRRWGIPRDPFGAAVVSSLGSLGLESAFIPLVAYSRAPIVIAPGAVVDEPVVENGQVVPGKVMRLNATFDHRMIDGQHAAVIAATIRRVFEEPGGAPTC